MSVFDHFVWVTLYGLSTPYLEKEKIFFFRKTIVVKLKLFLGILIVLLYSAFCFKTSLLKMFLDFKLFNFNASFEKFYFWNNCINFNLWTLSRGDFFIIKNNLIKQPCNAKCQHNDQTHVVNLVANVKLSLNFPSIHETSIEMWCKSIFMSHIQGDDIISKLFWTRPTVLQIWTSHNIWKLKFPCNVHSLRIIK